MADLRHEVKRTTIWLFFEQTQLKNLQEFNFFPDPSEAI
jgi:hypothetical protein